MVDLNSIFKINLSESFTSSVNGKLWFIVFIDIIDETFARKISSQSSLELFLEPFKGRRLILDLSDEETNQELKREVPISWMKYSSKKLKPYLALTGNDSKIKVNRFEFI